MDGLKWDMFTVRKRLWMVLEGKMESSISSVVLWSADILRHQGLPESRRGDTERVVESAVIFWLLYSMMNWGPWRGHRTLFCTVVGSHPLLFISERSTMEPTFRSIIGKELECVCLCMWYASHAFGPARRANTLWRVYHLAPINDQVAGVNQCIAHWFVPKAMRWWEYLLSGRQMLNQWPPAAFYKQKCWKFSFIAWLLK